MEVSIRNKSGSSRHLQQELDDELLAPLEEVGRERMRRGSRGGRVTWGPEVGAPRSSHVALEGQCQLGLCQPAGRGLGGAARSAAWPAQHLMPLDVPGEVGSHPGWLGQAGITAAQQLALAMLAAAWGSPAVTLPWKYQ